MCLEYEYTEYEGLVFGFSSGLESQLGKCLDNEMEAGCGGFM